MLAKWFFEYNEKISPPTRKATADEGGNMAHQREKKMLLMRVVALVIILLALLVLSKVARSEEGDYCSSNYLNIGANPIAPKQYNPMTEDLYSLSRNAFLEIGQKSGKTSKGCVRAGTKVVTPKGSAKIIRIYECGNPVYGEIYVGVSSMPATKEIDLSLPPATLERIERQQEKEDFLKEPPSKALGVALIASNCASAIAVGWGVKSKNETAGMVGVSMLVIEYAIDYAYGNDITFGDVLTTAVCGVVGAVVAPKPKKDEQPQSPPPNNPPPPQQGPTNPTTGPSGPTSPGN